MRDRKFLRGVAVCSVVLAVAFLPICKGATCCASNARTANIRPLAAAFIMSAAQEQSPPSPSPVNSPAATHKVKVWTNDELIATRTPADVYIFQKEEQAAALVVEGFNQIASCFAFGQAEGNAEETQRAIDTTIQSIRDSEEAVVQARRALGTAPDNLKLRNQMELSQRTAELNHAREQLWKLQEHLQELQKSPAQETATPAPQPNPAQPSPN
jgi:hypothetical protein